MSRHNALCGHTPDRVGIDARAADFMQLRDLNQVLGKFPLETQSKLLGLHSKHDAVGCRNPCELLPVPGWNSRLVERLPLDELILVPTK